MISDLEFRFRIRAQRSIMATITKLEIWQEGRKLALAIFEAYMNSEFFSKDYKLKEQINRSSSSIYFKGTKFKGRL